jgi:hypothetical protein
VQKHVNNKSLKVENVSERDGVVIAGVKTNNSVQFNSNLYYLCAESTATRPITDTEQCKQK